MIRLSSRAGSPERPNEDWCAAFSTPTGNMLIVLDGVTTPGETGCRHDTPWYVRSLGAELMHLASDRGSSLGDVLAQAISNVTQSHTDTCDTGHRGTPAATVAMARATDQHLEYLVLADATIAIRKGEDVQIVSDPRVSQITASDAAEALRHPIGTTEHTTAVRRMSHHQQLRRNRPGGYWVASSVPMAANHAFTGVSDHDTDVALFTDGASRIADLFAQRTWSRTMDLLRQDGPEALIDLVRATEHQDPQGRTWPRFKASDDAACVYCNLRE